MIDNNMYKKYAQLIFSIGLCLVAGVLGSLATTPAINVWYSGITKPSFNPPNWIFGPVWTALFILMGIALFLIWQKGLRNQKVKFAFGLFIVHLVINTLWSYIFFGWHELGLALFNIIVLWLMIAWLIYRFCAIDRRAAYLLLPYILWVSFASVLNFYIWYLN